MPQNNVLTRLRATMRSVASAKKNPWPRPTTTMSITVSLTASASSCGIPPNERRLSVATLRQPDSPVLARCLLEARHDRLIRWRWPTAAWRAQCTIRVLSDDDTAPLRMNGNPPDPSEPHPVRKTAITRGP